MLKSIDQFSTEFIASNRFLIDQMIDQFSHKLLATTKREQKERDKYEIGRAKDAHMNSCL